MIDTSFRDKIYDLVSQVPYGLVSTYGDLAGLAGHAYTARVVGGIAHAGPSELPWHRVVNRFGGLASGFQGGRGVQEALLLSEGVTCTNFVVDNFKEKRWNPNL
ncbi:MAG TPA: MGMT family protein [Candidatus Saccharimonadales bacterium]|nr:MGMT family protein [Candidatus Saccharimonadales bacterium]